MRSTRYALGAGTLVVARRLIRAVIVLALPFAPHAIAQNKSKFVDQVLIQRTFYAGDHLVFDDQGNPFRKYATCSWTLCAKIRVVDFRVDGETLRIRGQRLFLVADGPRGYVDVFSDPLFAKVGESLQRLKEHPRVRRIAE